METFKDLRTFEEERAEYSSKYHYSRETQKWSEFKNIVKKDFYRLYNWIRKADSNSSIKVRGSLDFYQERAQAFIHEIDGVQFNNIIHLYRVVRLDSFESLNKEDLGICWTWNPNNLDYLAKALTDPEYECEVRLHIKASLDNIDWFESFYLYCVYGDTEAELRLVDPEKSKLEGYLFLEGDYSPKRVLEERGDFEALIPEEDLEFSDLERWMKRHPVNSKGKVDLNTSLIVPDWLIENDRLAVSFGKVKGHFVVCNSRLTTLEGCPDYVGGDFDCSNTSITSLKGAPKEVRGGLVCNHTKIETLEGVPKASSYNFSFSENLISLKGAPEEVRGDFHIDFCSSLKSLEGVPKRIGGNFGFISCKNLQNLDIVPEYVGGNVSFRSTGYFVDEYKGEVKGRILGDERPNT